MGDMQRYENQPLGQEVVQFEGSGEGQGDSVENLIVPILRRWYVVFATAVVVCGIGVPAILFLMKPQFDTTGAIKISPIVNPILFESELDRLPSYDLFKNTQAEIIRGDNILNRVADALISKNLDYFSEVTDPVLALREIVAEEGIIIDPGRNTELLRISMTSANASEAEQIINTFLDEYMLYVDSEDATGGTNKLDILEAKKKSLEVKIKDQRDAIESLSTEFGTGELTSRQEIMLQIVARLQEELSAVTIQRISLEARVKMLDKENAVTMPDVNHMERQTAYLNSDPEIQSLTPIVREYETQLILDNETMAETNPELQRKNKLLATFKERLETRRKEVIAKFENDYNEELAKSQKYAIDRARAELQQAIEHENKIRERLEQQDSDTIGLGRKQLNIDAQQEELAQTRSLYNEVTRRIEEINMEQQRPARISIAFRASSLPAKGKRKKLAMATGFGGLALGVMFAFLLAKADKRLRNTGDVIKRVGVKIIGTTTSTKHIDKKMIGRQLMDDYQTIRANLGLLNGHSSSKVLAVTSPGMRDGKTTFSVNLALSFAQSGEKVLLIDGDLRKPDVAETLNLPRGLRGLQDFLFGKPLEECVYKLNSSGLHVLAADFRNSNDALDLLCQKSTAECMKNIGDGYDHVIIDTPPVLAFSDALVWSRMADAVILTSFAEHTSRPDLREAIDRLDEINAKVIGTVLNNVKVTESYHRYNYGYGYGSQAEKTRKTSKKKRQQRLLLEPVDLTEESSSGGV